MSGINDGKSKLGSASEIFRFKSKVYKIYNQSFIKQMKNYVLAALLGYAYAKYNPGCTSTDECVAKAA